MDTLEIESLEKEKRQRDLLRKGVGVKAKVEPVKVWWCVVMFGVPIAVELDENENVLTHPLLIGCGDSQFPILGPYTTKEDLEAKQNDDLGAWQEQNDAKL